MVCSMPILPSTDRRILDASQLRRVDASGAPIVPCSQQLRRTEKAAHVVGTERRRLTTRHSLLPAEIPRSAAIFTGLRPRRHGRRKVAPPV
jgi:hypothetical protein